MVSLDDGLMLDIFTNLIAPLPVIRMHDRVRPIGDLVFRDKSGHITASDAGTVMHIQTDCATKHYMIFFDSGTKANLEDSQFMLDERPLPNKEGSALFHSSQKFYLRSDFFFEKNSIIFHVPNQFEKKNGQKKKGGVKKAHSQT